MALKSKSKYHSESKSPLSSPLTSPVYLNPESEVTRASVAAAHLDISDQFAVKPPEVESMIHKLQGFSISPQRSDKSQSSVTSQYNPAHPLTRLKSEKFGIQPTELPLPTRKRVRKSPQESDSEILSSTSPISTTPLRIQPPTPPFQTIIHPSTTIPLQSSTIIVSSSSQLQRSSPPLFSTSISTMDQSPWNNPGAILMPAPLSPIPAHPEKWLPKFNLEAGMLAEEHINNFMLSINLNGVTNEDVVVRLFPYTLQGTAGSWYFSLSSGSITSWDIFHNQFLVKFGDDKSTATLINDLSNLKAQAKEPIKDFNLRFNKILNKIPTASQPSEEVRCEWYITALPSNIAIFVDRKIKQL